MCRETSWNATGVPALVKPAGNVIVGLPDMSNGEVNRIRDRSASRSWPSIAICFTVGEAISAATRKGAELLHADSLGRIAPGAVADLVVLNANPADDIAATRDIAWVMARGRILYPDSLRKTWSR